MATDDAATESKPDFLKREWRDRQMANLKSRETEMGMYLERKREERVCSVAKDDGVAEGCDGGAD
ncbi:hypothetical protein LguiA_007762 [Lonicera macranthoides]